MRKTLEEWLRDPLVNNIARVAYSAIREWCIASGQEYTDVWDNLPPKYQDHVRLVVARAFFTMEVPRPRQLHEACLEEGIANGWTYGEKVDREKKQHPDISPWIKLSMDQRIKEHLMSAIIGAFLEGA